MYWCMHGRADCCIIIDTTKSTLGSAWHTIQGWFLRNTFSYQVSSHIQPWYVCAADAFWLCVQVWRYLNWEWCCSHTLAHLRVGFCFPYRRHVIVSNVDVQCDVVADAILLLSAWHIKKVHGAIMSSDEEQAENAESFEVSQYDLDNEFNPHRSRKPTKEEQLYGVFAEDIPPRTCNFCCCLCRECVLTTCHSLGCIFGWRTLFKACLGYLLLNMLYVLLATFSLIYCSTSEHKKHIK